jgi:hypothetical protein
MASNGSADSAPKRGFIGLVLRNSALDTSRSQVLSPPRGPLFKVISWRYWRNGPDPSPIMASLQGISRTHLVSISTAKWAYLLSALADEMRVIATYFKELKPITDRCSFRQTNSVNQSGRLIPTAGIVEKVSGK